MLTNNPISKLTEAIEEASSALAIVEKEATNPQEREDIQALLIQLYETQLAISSMSSSVINRIQETSTTQSTATLVEQEDSIDHE